MKTLVLILTFGALAWIVFFALWARHQKKSAFGFSPMPKSAHTDWAPLMVSAGDVSEWMQDCVIQECATLEPNTVVGH